jgi:CBS-domain-containing membrane protein
MRKPTSNKKYIRLLESLIAGGGAFIGLSFIGLIAQQADSMMIIAPFGATAVLLFSAPKSNFSRPWNIFGGYIISTLIGAYVISYTGGGWFVIGSALGLTITLMHLGDVVHPPAGANLLIITQGHLSVYLLEPLFVGLVTLIIIAMSVERIKTKFM